MSGVSNGAGGLEPNMIGLQSRLDQMKDGQVLTAKPGAQGVTLSTKTQVRPDHVDDCDAESFANAKAQVRSIVAKYVGSDKKAKKILKAVLGDNADGRDGWRKGFRYNRVGIGRQHLASIIEKAKAERYQPLRPVERARLIHVLQGAGKEATEACNSHDPDGFEPITSGRARIESDLDSDRPKMTSLLRPPEASDDRPSKPPTPKPAAALDPIAFLKDSAARRLLESGAGKEQATKLRFLDKYDAWEKDYQELLGLSTLYGDGKYSDEDKQRVAWLRQALFNRAESIHKEYLKANAPQWVMQHPVLHAGACRDVDQDLADVNKDSTTPGHLAGHLKEVCLDVVEQLKSELITPTIHQLQSSADIKHGVILSYNGMPVEEMKGGQARSIPSLANGRASSGQAPSRNQALERLTSIRDDLGPEETNSRHLREKDGFLYVKENHPKWWHISHALTRWWTKARGTKIEGAKTTVHNEITSCLTQLQIGPIAADAMADKIMAPFMDNGRGLNRSDLDQIICQLKKLSELQGDTSRVVNDMGSSRMQLEPKDVLENSELRSLFVQYVDLRGASGTLLEQDTASELSHRLSELRKRTESSQNGNDEERAELLDKARRAALRLCDVYGLRQSYDGDYQTNTGGKSYAREAPVFDAENLVAFATDPRSLNQGRLGDLAKEVADHCQQLHNSAVMPLVHDFMRDCVWPRDLSSHQH